MQPAGELCRDAAAQAGFRIQSGALLHLCHNPNGLGATNAKYQAEIRIISGSSFRRVSGFQFLPAARFSLWELMDVDQPSDH